MESYFAAIASQVTFTTARRVNHSLTAGMESRALQWMANRAPRWLTSDQLTALGFGAQLLAGLCYALCLQHRRALLLVNVCIAVNWLGDSLDGTLARTRKQQRPRYGFYVDHIADVFGTLVLMAGLAASGLAHWQTAAAMLITFLVLCTESYLATYTLSCFELSQGLFGPTELRILLIIGNLELLRNPYVHLFGRRMLLFDMGGAFAAAAMLVIALVTALRHTAQLYREEPLP